MPPLLGWLIIINSYYFAIFICEAWVKHVVSFNPLQLLSEKKVIIILIMKLNKWSLIFKQIPQSHMDFKWWK